MIEQDLTIEIYQKMLDGFDWYYDYTDDIQVWRRGNEFRSMLTKMAHDNGSVFKDAWNAACEKRNLQSMKI